MNRRDILVAPVVEKGATSRRLYLPREGLLQAGITSTDPLEAISDPALPKVCAPLVERARTHFETEKNADVIVNLDWVDLGGTFKAAGLTPSAAFAQMQSMLGAWRTLFRA